MKNHRRASTIAPHAKTVDTELVTAIKQSTVTPAHKHYLDSLYTNAQHDFPDIQTGLSAYEEDLRARLGKAVFVGHINTDLDSVAGAVGAATLFGGTAALAEPLNEINGEISFALKNCGLEPPVYFGDLPHAGSCAVCLVDHTESKQMVPMLRDCPNRTDRIVGVIDHHALASSFHTNRPIFMDLRPWGSMSTIVGYLFVSQRKALSKQLAVFLLQAILSDTLNLRSVTTTNADRSMVALLSSYGGLGKLSMTLPSAGDLYADEGIDLLAKKQFQAKTDWIAALGPYEMVRGDQKDFACGPWKIGISVLEVTLMDGVLKYANDMLLELRLLKKEKGLVAFGDDDDDDDEGTVQLNRTMELDFAFLFVVNVVTQNTILLICGGRELALAKAAFLENEEINPDGKSVRLQEASPGICAPGSTIKPSETAMVLPKGYVSRKAQFVPAFFNAILDDFEYKKGPVSQTQEENEQVAEKKAASILEKIKISKNTYGAERRMSSLRDSFRSNAMEMLILREESDDKKLVQVNERTSMARHGNPYDENGRVVRTYQLLETVQDT